MFDTNIAPKLLSTGLATYVVDGHVHVFKAKQGETKQEFIERLNKIYDLL